MSQQQTVLVLGFDNQDTATLEVLQSLLGEEKTMVFCGFSRRTWWLKPHLKSSKIKLVTEVNTRLSWGEVDSWIASDSFIRVVIRAIRDKSSLKESPSLILVSDELMGNDHLKRALDVAWRDVNKQLINATIASFWSSDEYNQYRAKLDTVIIEELGLGVRGYNILKFAGMRTIGDLASKSSDELQALPYSGKKTVAEIMRALYKRGTVSS